MINFRRHQNGTVSSSCHSTRERGDTLVEFAISLAVFLATILGTAQLGLTVWHYNMLSNLAQEGARWASVRGINSTSPASTAQVQSFVHSRSLGLNPTVTTYSVNPSTKACSTTATNPSTLGGGSGICVKVQKSVAPLTRLVPLGTLTLQSTAQMIMAR